MVSLIDHLKVEFINMKNYFQMHIRWSYLFCFSLLFTKSFSQKVDISFEVKSSTYNAIPFATLTMLNENKQYVCNLNGKFIGIADVKDSFLISSVGFIDSILYVRNFQKNQIVILRQKITIMDEVIIKVGKKQLLGNLNLKHDRSVLGISSTTPSFEIAKLIKAKGIYNEFKLLTLSFRQRHFCKTMPLIVHIYSVDKSGLPDKDLLIDSPFIVRPDMFKQGIITIDVRHANIILRDEDFFVGLQLLYPFDEKLTTNYDNTIAEIKRDPEDLAYRRGSAFDYDIGIRETKREAEQLTYRRSRVFKNRWYADYTTGIIIPKQNLFNEERHLENSDSSNLKPLNLIAEVEIEVFP